MLDKRSQIIEAALHCFAQKGYHATSIQEIVDRLGIAKGSVYFYFKSKEDLLFSAIKHTAEQMSLAVFNETTDDSLSPQETLRRQLTVQFEKCAEHRSFLMMLLTEQALQVNDTMRRYMLDLRVGTMKWIHGSLMSIYGTSVQPYAWDVSSVMMAIINEYTGYIVFEQRSLVPQAIADFILERMDDVVQGMIRKQRDPILAEAVILSWLNELSINDTLHDWQQDIAHLRGLTGEHPEWSQLEKDELLSFLLVLEHELLKSDPEPIIVRNMLRYVQDREGADWSEFVSMLEAKIQARLTSE